MSFRQELWKYRNRVDLMTAQFLQLSSSIAALRLSSRGAALGAVLGPPGPILDD
jgi:hypothetical protein